MKTINRINQFVGIYCLCISSLMLTACSTSQFPWVYRIDIDQGNVIDEEKFEQVNVGMTRRQVKYLLGTPLIQDTFNQQRWDYFYAYKTGKGAYERENITMVFNGDTLASIDRRPIEEFIID